MEDCIFCKIVRGEIPSENLFENDTCLSFLDIMPSNKGHALVIPKEHYETLVDIPDEDLKDLMIAVKKVALALKKALDFDGFNIFMNNKKVAGQLVPHAHFHILPRFDNDGLKVEFSHKEYEEGEIRGFRERIAKFI